MYRNCIYNNRSKTISLWTWDAHGNRVTQELDYKPYIYLEHKLGQDKSIYGTSIKKKEFESQWDRNKFVTESGIKRVFENLPPYQQFLIDNYYHCNGDDDFSKYPLKVMFIDIECPINQNGSNSFPDPDKAENTIDLLTCYDNFSKTYTVFGLKPYTPTSKNVNYTHCKSEKDLLKKFVNFFMSDYPDCLVGYNSNNFDIPYIINRITFEIGEDWVKKLSPVGRYYERFNKEGKFGAPSKEYVIEGISCLDYYVMYKKFAMEPLESYRLDYVAEVELDENKIEYIGSLADLCVKDWNTYVNYNLKDVEILVKLDDKLRYIELLRFISYLGLCSMDNAIKTVPVVNGAVAIRARHRGEKIPTFIRPQTEGKIPGGHVAHPKRGFSKNVVSFDANSLYPSVMISLNMSPETKYGTYEKVDDGYVLKHVSGRTFEFSKDNFMKIIKEEKLCRSEMNVLFTQKKKGLMPEFLDFLYSKRKEMKSKMLQMEKEFEKNKKNLSKKEQSEIKAQIQKFDTFQHAYKITLNSTYGYCANKYAPLGDDEIGASVTLTGQAIIKKSNDLFVEYLNQNHTNLKQSPDQYIVYNDTDSIYISLDFLDQNEIPLKNEKGHASEKFLNICQNIEDQINEGCNIWAKKKLWSLDSRFVFKREAICDHAIFIGKKYYVLHMIDKEGIPTNKYKYKGVDVVKSTMPKALKPYVKKIIETMIDTQSLRATNDAFMTAYEIFKSLGVDSIYKNSNINNYEKYAEKCTDFVVANKTPGHVKAAYYHDLLIDKLGLENKYAKFKSGEKVKSVYLKVPNKYGIDCIGFKSKFPEEFSEIFEVDYEKMFGKILYAAIERFYESVNWKLRKPNENLKLELEEFFA